MIVLGIAGFARSGKDTFVSIAKEILGKNGYTASRVAFADKLKDEVVNMLKHNYFKADVYTTNTDDKTLLRPLLVWWGCQRRRESDGGLYWVERANAEINSTVSSYDAHIPSQTQKLVFLVSDVRFPNEAKWVKEDLGGEVIHLKRYSIRVERLVLGGEWENIQYFDPAPNEEELKQDPLVIEMADHKIEWENKGNLPPEKAVLEPYLRNVVFETLNKSKFFNGSLQK